MSLVLFVREMSGASATEATDARIVEALNRHSVRVENQLIHWDRVNPDGSVRRVAQAAIGRYRVEATATTGATIAAAPTLHNAAGVALAQLAIDHGGVVTASGSDPLPTAYLSGRLFDVHAAAIEIVDLRIAAAAGAFDFKRGDQEFDRSQIVVGLRALRDGLARGVIPRASGEVTMSDQAMIR